MTRRARLALWLTAWASALALLWLASRGVDWGAATLVVRQARLSWLAVAVLANLAILLLWAVLWRMLLPRTITVHYARMFEIASVTSAIMNTIPALVGHASAVALLVKRGGMPVRTAGSIMAIDQVGEGLSKLAVLAVAFWLVDLPDWMMTAAGTVAGAVGVLAMVLLAVALSGRLRLSDTRAARLLHAVRDDLQVARSPSRAVGAIAIALAMKAAEAAAIASVILAIGIDVPLSSAFVVLGAVNLATMLPIAPGNVGTYEAGAVAAYRWLGVAPEAALAAAIVQHVVFLLPAVGTGAFWLAARGAVIAREDASAPTAG